jgi:hypothetical protein
MDGRGRLPTKALRCELPVEERRKLIQSLYYAVALVDDAGSADDSAAEATAAVASCAAYKPFMAAADHRACQVDLRRQQPIDSGGSSQVGFYTDGFCSCVGLWQSESLGPPAVGSGLPLCKFEGPCLIRSCRNLLHMPGWRY